MGKGYLKVYETRRGLLVESLRLLTQGASEGGQPRMRLCVC